MRIARLQVDGQPRVAVVHDDAMRVSTLDGRLAGDTPALVRHERVLEALRTLAETGRGAAAEVAIDEVTLLAPVARSGKIVAIGLNYRDHAAEVGLEIPAQPLVFAKFPSAIVGPDAPIGIDADVTEAVDHEGRVGGGHRSRRAVHHPGRRPRARSRVYLAE